MKKILILVGALLSLSAQAALPPGVAVMAVIQYSFDGSIWNNAGFSEVNSYPITNEQFFAASTTVQTSNNFPGMNWVTLTVWSGPTLSSMTNKAFEQTVSLFNSPYYRPTIAIVKQMP